MPGYILITQRELRPHKIRGMQPFPEVVGFLDFLRDLRQDGLPFHMGARVRVEGLDEVLYSGKPDYTPLALKIRQILQGAANEMDQRLVTVQIVLRDRIERGSDLRVIYRDEPLPIHLIFNSSTSEEFQGSTVYRVALNLT
jgi:hypothetical protein